MSTTHFYLTPFTLSVLNVAIMLTLLVAFLLRIRDKSAAARSLLFFLIGVDMVFAAFIYIFSSLDLQGVTRAWWLLHGVIFFIPFLLRFAYSYPQPHFERERQRLEPWLAAAALLGYGGYLYHTAQLQPVFAPGGYLFVYLGTPEIGIVIGAMLAWTIVVFWRTIKRLQQQRHEREPGIERQISAIRKLMLVLFSPVALLASIVLAYQGLVSWELIAHLLGSGVMIFLFIFTVIYLNNSLEPTTLLIKVVGLSLGAILILLGLAASLTMSLYKQEFLTQKEQEIARITPAIIAATRVELPADIAYLLVDGTPRYHAAAQLLPLAEHRVSWEQGWLFREGATNQPQQFYLARQGEVAGHRYEVGYSYLEYRRHLHQMAKPLAWLAIGAAWFVLLVFPLFFRLSLFNPLRRLLAGVAAVDEGNLEVQVPIATHDEIGRLTHSFNHMTDSVRESRAQLRSAFDYQRDLTEAYSRFVPKEILTTLNKKTILELGLGDGIQKEMTILFSDIRAFTSLSERMSPSEIFQFINRYLERVGPVVRKHGGYIDKYIGDAVMALFPTNAAAAIEAAIEMQAQVRSFNEECLTGATGLPEAERAELAIRIGIGIHTGELILGTIGEKERMEGTVISDAVNLASRLEELTKLYDAPVVISQGTLERLAADHGFAIRALDRVRVRGKRESVDIYEVMDGDFRPLRADKLAGQREFEQGITLFRAAHFEAAQALFSALEARGVADATVAIYLERCQQLLQERVAAGWDGAMTVA